MRIVTKLKQNDGSVELRLITGIIFIGTLLAILYNFFYQGVVLKKTYPFNTFLFLPGHRFTDFYIMIDWCKHLNPYFEPHPSANSNYLPLANLFFYFASLIPKQASMSLFVLVFSALLFWFSYKAIPVSETRIKRIGYAFIISFFNYGYLWCLDRANLELFVVVTIISFLFFYQKGNDRLAILFLSLAIATKIYPAIFLVLYVADRKYREVAITAFVSLVLVFVPLLFHKGGYLENLNYMLNGFETDFNTVFFVGAFDDDTTTMLNGSSLFSALKVLNIKLSLGLKHMLGGYMIAVALIALLVLLYIILVEKELWRKVTLLVCLIIALPHISLDYKLPHFIYCIQLFLMRARNSDIRKHRPDWFSILFGVLLIPKSYLFFSGITTTTTSTTDVPIGSLLNPLLMLGMIGLIISGGLKAWYVNADIRGIILSHFRSLKGAVWYLVPLVLLLVPYILLKPQAKAKYTQFKAHNFKARELFEDGKGVEAIAELQQAFRERPYRYKVPLQIATIYSTMGQADSARAYYMKTSLMYPESTEARQGIIVLDINAISPKAIQLFTNGNFRQAITEFEKVIGLFFQMYYNPSNQAFLVNTYCNLCACYMNLNELQNARQVCQEIVALDPQNTFAATNLPRIDAAINATISSDVSR